MGKEKESRNAVGVAVRREYKNVYEDSDAAGNLSLRVSADHVDIGKYVVCVTEISDSRKKMMWIANERNLAVAKKRWYAQVEGKSFQGGNEEEGQEE